MVNFRVLCESNSAVLCTCIKVGSWITLALSSAQHRKGVPNAHIFKICFLCVFSVHFPAVLTANCSNASQDRTGEFFPLVFSCDPLDHSVYVGYCLYISQLSGSWDHIAGSHVEPPKSQLTGYWRTWTSAELFHHQPCTLNK